MTIYQEEQRRTLTDEKKSSISFLLRSYHKSAIFFVCVAECCLCLPTQIGNTIVIQNQLTTLKAVEYLVHHVRRV